MTPCCRCKLRESENHPALVILPGRNHREWEVGVVHGALCIECSDELSSETLDRIDALRSDGQRVHDRRDRVRAITALWETQS